MQGFTTQKDTHPTILNASASDFAGFEQKDSTRILNYFFKVIKAIIVVSTNTV